MDNRVELAKELVEKSNYLNKDIVYLKNIDIREYDVASAGFTVIKFKKLLPEETIQSLEKLSKMERNIRIGKLSLRHPIINEEIIKTLEKVRKAFVMVNHLYPEDILSIKKDALFLIKKNPRVLKIKDFEFRSKENYTSYCYLNRKEFYYSSYHDKLDIKGLSSDVKEAQEKYFLNDIKRFLKLGEKLSKSQMFDLLKQYRRKYLSRKLPKETYLSLDSGTFRIGNYGLKSIAEGDLVHVDITQNYLNYLLPLFNAFM